VASPEWGEAMSGGPWSSIEAALVRELARRGWEVRRAPFGWDAHKAGTGWSVTRQKLSEILDFVEERETNERKPNVAPHDNPDQVALMLGRKFGGES
jgi:hypothetical protein